MLTTHSPLLPHLLFLFLATLTPVTFTLSCHTCGDIRIVGEETKRVPDADFPTCLNVTLWGTTRDCELEEDVCFTLRMSLDITDPDSAAPATTLLAGCGSSSERWMREKAPRCGEQGMTCSNNTCAGNLCNAVDIRGYELYVPAPYNSRSWILPGVVISFLIVLILLMILMNIRERSQRYKMLMAEQRQRQEDGKTNGKVTQHFALPPGIDISANVYPSKSVDA